MKAAAHHAERDLLAFDLAQARDFLEALFADVPGLIELRTIAEGTPPEQSFHANVESVLRGAESTLSRSRNVYVALATRRDRSSGRKDNLHAVRCLWADVDDLLDVGAREAHEIALAQFQMPPSMRVWSGGGEHVYWLLEEPFDLTTPEAVVRFEHALKGIRDVLHADPAAAEAARVLRIPGSWNLPDARKRAKGREIVRVELLRC